LRFLQSQSVRRRHSSAWVNMISFIVLLTTPFSAFADPLTPYLGEVATRGRYPEIFSLAETRLMSRIQHVGRADIEEPRLVFVNFYGKEEAGPGGLATVASSLEYPIGKFTPVAFNGARTAAIPDGSQVMSDAVPIRIPAGATFREWTWYGNPAGVIMSGTSRHVDGASFGQSAGNGVAEGGELPPSDRVYGATAIIGLTDRPSILVIGDSRAGAPDFEALDTNDDGNLPRAIGGDFAYINVAVSGETLYQELTRSPKRRAFARYCSDVAIASGINDLNSSPAPFAIANLGSLVASYGDKRHVFVSTLEPQTASGSSWTAADGSDQIVHPVVESRRQMFNAAVRAGIPGAAGFFDLAALSELSPGSGKWRPLLTGDGVHGNARYLALIPQAHIVPPVAFAH
jgi:hypothetical protein